jgi:hypothetical protein
MKTTFTRNVVIALCAAFVAIGAAIPFRAHAQAAIPWSVELVPENTDFLLFKIDATRLPPNAVLCGISFAVTFYNGPDRRSAIATDTFTVPEDVAVRMKPGVINGAYVAHSRASAQSVQGISLTGLFTAAGEKADDPNATRFKSQKAIALSKFVNLAGSAPNPKAATKGNLLWSKDTRRNGTGEVLNSSIIGHGGWQHFRNIFSGGDGIIYAITQDGNLLWYKDTQRNGKGVVANSKLIGRGGWQDFRHVFSGGDGSIYAITQGGELLWYKDTRRDGTGEVGNPKVIGRGWQNFRHVFSGGDGVIYAITPNGDLLWHKDARRNGTGVVADPKVIGRGGWQNFRHVFSGGDGIIYAVTPDGNLLWYKDIRRNGTGEVANTSIIGRGGWQNFKNVFSGGNGIIYAVTSE